MFDSLRVGSYRNGKEMKAVVWHFLVTNHFSITRSKRKLVEQWNKYLSVKWDCVQKHFKLHNLKLGPRVVVSWNICWSAADMLLLLYTTTIWTITEVVKIISLSWVEWHSCWRSESSGMWHCVIGWVFPSILKGQVTKSHSIHICEDFDLDLQQW
jgi:hypothetical protein